MADIDDHPAAVQRELEPQLWSTKQPWFAERLAALTGQDLEPLASMTASSALLIVKIWSATRIAHNCHTAGVNSASQRPLVWELRGGATTT